MLQGKNGLILGVANEFSLAAFVAARASEQGASLSFSFLPDASSGGAKAEKRVRRVVDPFKPLLLMPCDLNREASTDAFFDALQDKMPRVDFMVHSVAWAPLADILCKTIDASRAGFLEAMETSVYSFLSAVRRVAGLMPDGGSIVTMTYYGGEKVVDGYNLMGVCKAALESAVRYAASEMGPRGIRINAISAGPMKTLSASAVQGLDGMLALHQSIAPMRRNINGSDVANTACWLASDSSLSVTGEILHADCGYSIMGGPPFAPENLRDAVSNILKGN